MMELHDYFFKVLLKEVNDLRTEELMEVHWSLKKAVEKDQYKELQDFKGDFCGFVTWEMRELEKIKKIEIGITNLVIIKEKRGTYCLTRIINYLRAMYPNANSFVWKSRKKQKILEFKQRGTYVEHLAKNI